MFETENAAYNHVRRLQRRRLANVWPRYRTSPRCPAKLEEKHDPFFMKLHMYATIAYDACRSVSPCWPIFCTLQRQAADVAGTRDSCFQTREVGHNCLRCLWMRPSVLAHMSYFQTIIRPTVNESVFSNNATDMATDQWATSGQPAGH